MDRINLRCPECGKNIAHINVGGQIQETIERLTMERDNNAREAIQMGKDWIEEKRAREGLENELATLTALVEHGDWMNRVLLGEVLDVLNVIEWQGYRNAGRGRWVEACPYCGWGKYNRRHGEGCRVPELKAKIEARLGVPG